MQEKLTFVFAAVSGVLAAIKLIQIFYPNFCRSLRIQKRKQPKPKQQTLTESALPQTSGEIWPFRAETGWTIIFIFITLALSILLVSANQKNTEFGYALALLKAKMDKTESEIQKIKNDYSSELRRAVNHQYKESFNGK